MHGTESQGHSIAPRSRGVAKLSSAMAWNSKAEVSHGEAAQGRSGDGRAKTRGAKAWKEERSKAKARKGVVSQRQSGAERSVLRHGIELPCFINQKERRKHEKV